VVREPSFGSRERERENARRAREYSQEILPTSCWREQIKKTSRGARSLSSARSTAEAAVVVAAAGAEFNHIFNPRG
jgi:hypothetical protein